MQYLTTELLEKSTPDSAGYDLRADLGQEGVGTHIYPGMRKLIKTGIKCAMPPGKAMLVLSRSGLALKHGVFVLNAPGLIDPDYRGDVGVILMNAGEETFQIMHGDKIAQALFVDYYDPEQIPMNEEDLPKTFRGEGGFGSTGRK